MSPPLVSGASGASDQGEAAPWIPQRFRAIPFRLGRAVTGTVPPVPERTFPEIFLEKWTGQD
jgi:hypothetical protein